MYNITEQKGFSLFEVLIATTMLFIAIAALMSTFQAAVFSNAATEEEILATSALHAQVEELKILPVDSGTSDPCLKDSDHFGERFLYEYHFEVPGLRNADPGNPNPAGGAITAVLPTLIEDGLDQENASLTEIEDAAQELIEFRLKVAYESTAGGLKEEEIVIWISPQY